MKKTRRRKITVETERLLVIGRTQRRVEGWCEACQTEVRMIGVEEAAVVAHTSQRDIFRSIESGRLHFVETTRGALLICLESLLTQSREADE